MMDDDDGKIKEGMGIYELAVRRGFLFCFLFLLPLDGNSLAPYDIGMDFHHFRMRNGSWLRVAMTGVCHLSLLSARAFLRSRQMPQ